MPRVRRGVGFLSRTLLFLFEMRKVPCKFRKDMLYYKGEKPHRRCPWQSLRDCAVGLFESPCFRNPREEKLLLGKSFGENSEDGRFGRSFVAFPTKRVELILPG